MASDKSPLLMIGVLAAAVGAAYLYFKNACATPLAAGATWPPASICAMSMFAPVAATPVTAAPSAAAAPAAQTPAQIAAAALAAAQAACVAPNLWNNSTGTCVAPAPVTPPATTPTIAGLRAAMLQLAGAGSDGATFTIDQWNYYQNIANPPALTGSQFGQVVAAATSLFPGYVQSSYYMTVDQFLQALAASGVYAGLSGLGEMTTPMMNAIRGQGYAIPTWAIHRGGFA